MNLQQVTEQADSGRRRKRVGRGRGSGSGKTCGRGHNGFGQRSGWKRRGMQEGGQMPVFRLLPKRGFSNFRFRTQYSVVNIGSLESKFENEAHVTPQSLREVGLIRHLRYPVKILGEGTLTKKLTVDAAKYSKSAAEKIQAVGGEAREGTR